MKNMLRIIALILCILPSLATDAADTPPASRRPREAAPGAPPVFGAEIEMVTVDVVVADKKGAPIPGLRKEDFLVQEDGVLQRITRFESMRLPDRPSAKTPQRPPVSSNATATTRPGRTFAIAVDDIQLDLANGHRAKLAVAEFLRTGVREGDRVTLMATGGGAWWSAEMESGREDLMEILKKLEGRRVRDFDPREYMSEYEALRIHVYNDTQTGAVLQRRFEDSGALQVAGQDDEMSQRYQNTSTTHPYIEMRALEIYQQSRSFNRITLNALKRLLDSLSVVRGRKALILVSQGFVFDTQLDEFKLALQAARRANVAIYFLDTRGLGGTITPFSAEFGAPMAPQDFGALFADQTMAAEGAEFLASESGGFSVKNTNDLGAGILRIANESRSYYLLGYTSSNAARDGRYRKIEVKINRRNLNVRARRGYYAPLEGGAAPPAPEADERDPEIQKALDAPFDIEGIPLRMGACVFEEKLLGRARVVLSAEVDIRKLDFKEEEGRFVDTLEMVLFVIQRESGEYYQYPQQIDMRLKPETRQRTSWHPIQREFELSSGAYQARLVVRDKNSGQISSVIHSFDVPPLGAWRVSTPIVTDTLTSSDAGQHAVIQAHRRFTRKSTLYCHFEVYNPAKDPVTGVARIQHGFKVVRADGRLERFVQPSRIVPSPSGSISRLFGFPLSGLQPGDYEIVLTVTDELQGQIKELREPFSVVADSAEG